MSDGAQQVMALVIEAEDPLDNRMQMGDRYQGWVRILVDSGSEPILVRRRFHMDPDRWLLRGMEVPVTIDPADPAQFEVRWDEVPGIEQLAAANDPTLTDAAGTRGRVAERLTAAMGAGVNTPSQDPEQAGLTALFGQVQMEGEYSAKFKASLEQASQGAAPEGKTRAVAVIAASTSTMKMDHMGAEDNPNYYRTRDGKHAAVLAVTVPGSETYAVYEPKFDHKKGKGFVMGAGMPALVSAGDPADVEVLWDEMLSVKEQAEQTAAAAMQEAQDRMAAFTQGAQAAQGSPAPPVAAAPGGAPGAAPGLTPEMRQMMIQNARTALAAVPPQMRKMMIQQYRAAGIEIDEQGNVSE
jgi:hypothetical protein